MAIKTFSLPENQVNILLTMIEEASEALSNRSCNDYDLPNTDENWALYEEMHAENLGISVEEWRQHEEFQERPPGKNICFYNWWLLDFLAGKIKVQL